jgi:hypothetical protein
MHGLAQSEALTVAARLVTKRRTALERHRETYPDDAGLIQILTDRYNDAKEDYALAYQRYTNPFGVSKTVDARWPAVKD